ncbi:hypothetical protein L596_014653 [Steinernema carpocapsae]|uniref:Uncharacterized protein n=1 Tax=Steinernema carpocapsae TaxID=34508 RepID=A0A4U5NDB9_STECR|nr:hypothetical protein L596_014653 [Steinernema carpocapsae]
MRTRVNASLILQPQCSKTLLAKSHTDDPDSLAPDTVSPNSFSSSVPVLQLRRGSSVPGILSSTRFPRILIAADSSAL